MHAVYLACLVGGAVATVLFAALGAFGGAAGHGAGHLHADAGHAGAHLHAASAHGQSLSTGTPGPAHALPAAGAHAHVAAHAQAGQAGAHGHAAHAQSGGAAQPATASSWLAVASGWTLSWLSPLTLAAAALWFGGAGLVAESTLRGAALPLAVAAAIVGAALVRALMGAFVRASVAPLQQGAVGALGTVNAAIRPDAAGEVIYTLEGLRRGTAARSLDGGPIPRGTEVIIVRRERGMAWVTPLDPLDALEAPKEES